MVAPIIADTKANATPMPHPSTSSRTSPEIAGERRLRQVLFVVDLLAFLGIGASALYIWWFWPRGADVYSVLQRGASEHYLLLWMGIALLGAITALSRRTRTASFLLSLVLLSECLAQLYFTAINHHPYHPWARAILERFEAHPILAAIPHPSAFGGLSHDAMHRRTTINEGKSPDAKLVYVFGGSSAYDIGVNDAETWASVLSSQLGPGYAVENYGVPGYTSMEAMIQSLFVFRDRKPACAVYYEGWNDLAHAHVDNLANDYSPFQSERVMGSLAIDYRPGPITNNWLFLQLLDRAVQKGRGFPGFTATISDKRDERLAQIYNQNLQTIADIDRHFGVTPIFVPQILNYGYIESHKNTWWPYSPGTAIRPLMKDLNEEMGRAAKAAGAAYLDAPLTLDWTDSDFVDEGHFAAPGAAKFAKAIAPGVAAGCK